MVIANYIMADAYLRALSSARMVAKKHGKCCKEVLLVVTRLYAWLRAVNEDQETDHKFGNGAGCCESSRNSEWSIARSGKCSRRVR